MTIRIEQTLDYERVASIFTHPKLYPWLSDDFYPPPEQFWPNTSPSVIYLLAFEGDELLGLFMANPINSILWEAHHALLPSCWGARAAVAGEAFLAWLWTHTLCEKVLGFTPGDNKLAIRYAQRLGMKIEGRIKHAIKRRGELHDLVILGQERKV